MVEDPVAGRLESIRGQDRAVLLLSRYLQTGRVPPGLLFFGEEGTGKETAASAFAAALLCRSPDAGGACGKCPDCRAFAAGSHPNFLRIAPDGPFLTIEEIRALREELALKAFSDRARVALIVPADAMTLQAANALLKTLEEPPPGTHLLLVAHRLFRLPATIVSRCHKVPFLPLSPEVVEEILLSLPQVGKAYDRAALRAAAACAGGRPGLSLALLSEPSADRDAWIRRLSRLDPAEAVEAALAFKGTGGDAARFAVPLFLLRDAAVLSTAPKAVIMNADKSEAIQALASRRDAAAWTEALESLLAVSLSSPQVQKRLSVEAFLFRLHGDTRR